MTDDRWGERARHAPAVAGGRFEVGLNQNNSKMFSNKQNTVERHTYVRRCDVMPGKLFNASRVHHHRVLGVDAIMAGRVADGVKGQMRRTMKPHISPESGLLAGAQEPSRLAPSSSLSRDEPKAPASPGQAPSPFRASGGEAQEAEDHKRPGRRFGDRRRRWRNSRLEI
jgi:hypothetical protein